jgi:hypothetical protein
MWRRRAVRCGFSGSRQRNLDDIVDRVGAFAPEVSGAGRCGDRMRRGLGLVPGAWLRFVGPRSERHQVVAGSEPVARRQPHHVVRGTPAIALLGVRPFPIQRFADSRINADHSVLRRR